MAVLGPVPQSERYASLDVLRGVAVLGILSMNIQSFAMIGAAYMNPSAYGDLTGVNRWIWVVGHVLADTKFWAIFSMLFGAGILLMTSRCEATGRSAAGVHYRRMAWLLLFGLLHAHLLWYGDILYSYALCGMVAFLFRKLPPAWLIVLGLGSMSIGFGVNQLFQLGLEGGVIPQEQLAQSWSPADEQVQRELAAYRGGWFDQALLRSGTAFFFETFLFAIFVGWRTGGLVLIGMALFKLGVFTAARSRAFYLGLVAAGLLVGVPLISYGAYLNFQAGWGLERFFAGQSYNFWAGVLVALAWVGAVMLVVRSGRLLWMTRPLAAVGQMALTNYLMQTVICTTIFYGHGFGLFGRLERWQQVLVVAAVWVVELAWSPLWLRYFRFGPAEWLWRSLTYLKPQPMRRV